jgi:hypothetical protein
MLSKKARSSGVNVARSPSGLASRRACAFTQAGASTNGVNLDPDPYSSAGNMSVATPHSWSTSPKIINPARRPPSHADHPRTQTTLARRPPSHARRQHPRTHGNSTLARTETAPKGTATAPKGTYSTPGAHARTAAGTHTHTTAIGSCFSRHNQRSTRRKHPFHFATSLRVRIQEARRVVGKTNAVTSLQRHSECSPLVPVSNFPGSAPIVLNTYTKRSGGEKRGSAAALTLVTTQPTGRRCRLDGAAAGSESRIGVTVSE